MFGLDSKESSFPGKFNLYNPVFKNAEIASKIRPEGIHVPIIWNPHLVVLSILAAIFGSFSDPGLMILDDEFHWYAGFPFVRSLI